MAHQALWTLADNAKYTPFPRYPETRARNVYPSMAYSCACGIQKMQLPFSSRWQIAERHFCYWPKWFFPTLSQWHHLSLRLNFEARIQTDCHHPATPGRSCQPLPNGSDSRLTLVSPATLYMLPTSTSSPRYEWICPLSVSLTTQSQSSQPRGKPHYSALAVGNHTRL